MKSILTFRCRGSLYAVPAQAVREVTEMPALSAWPAAPEGVVGVIDYRGELIPVLDIASRVGSAPHEAPQESDQLIVVEVAGEVAALWVDEALELSASESCRPLPEKVPSSLKRAAPYLLGTTGSGERVVLELDLAALLSFADITPAALTAYVEPSALLAERARELATPLAAREDVEQHALVVVQLSGERLGVPVAEVAELTRCPSYTPVPGAPPHLLGLAYHRGELLRLVDVRAMCGLDDSGPTPDELVVLSGPGMLTGLVVDSIEAVVGLKGSGTKLSFEDGWLTVLDTERLDIREPALDFAASGATR